MTITSGTIINQYKIVSAIGKGGMGEVYEAVDSKLDREVAIKILPSDFARDPERLRRFEQEAKAASALNHPNILTIYDVDEHEGSPFIVTELLKGCDLRTQLEKGRLPIKTAVNYALQIISGLSKAHNEGIVHRDLKPENLFVTEEDRIKILDFGLAKFNVKELGASGFEKTTRKAMTIPGTVLGTAAYMSPEQIRASHVDQRSDVFSFGLVFYEMITGRHAFERGTSAEMMAAILNEEVPGIGKSGINSSPSLVRIVERCLEKKPERRFQAIADVGFALEAELLAGSSPGYLAEDSGTGPVERKAKWGWRFLAAGMVLTALISALTVWSSRRSSSVPNRKFALNIVVPEEIRLPGVGESSSVLELSPEGDTLLFGTNQGLFLRRLDSMELTKIREMGPLNTHTIFWKDSTSASYVSVSEDRLVSFRIPDGLEETLKPRFTKGYFRGGDWSDDGRWLISKLDWLETDGPDGQPVIIENTKDQGGTYFLPQFIPGSHDFIVFFRTPSATTGEIRLATLSDNVMTNSSRLFENDTPARFTPAGGGHLLFVRNDNLYAQKLDIRGRALVGEPRMIAAGVGSQPALDRSNAEFSVSNNGVIAWLSGRAAVSQVTLFDRSGNRIGTAGPSESIETIRLSPTDDRRLLVNQGIDRSFIFEVDKSGRSMPGIGYHWIEWAPDGEALIAVQENELFVRNADGGTAIPLGKYPGDDYGILGISSDRNDLLVACRRRGPLCWSRRVDEHSFGDLVPLTTSDSPCFDASFSPDRTFILYSAVGEGIFVQSFPGPGRRWQIDAGGRDPIWRRDGKEILFIDGVSVMSITVTMTSAGPVFGKPQKLFDGFRPSSSSVQRSRGLAVSSDGAVIYLVQAVEQPERRVINIMYGFFDNE